MGAWRVRALILEYAIIMAVCVGAAFALCALDELAHHVRTKIESPKNFHVL